MTAVRRITKTAKRNVNVNATMAINLAGITPCAGIIGTELSTSIAVFERSVVMTQPHLGQVDVMVTSVTNSPGEFNLIVIVS